MELLPSSLGIMGVRISPQTQALQHLQRYHFARHMAFREAPGREPFELLQPTDPLTNSVTLNRLMNLNREVIRGSVNIRRRPPLITGNGASNVARPRPRLSALTDALRQLARVAPNTWQLERGQTGNLRPINAVLDIPNLGLRTAEAAVYQVEMYNEQKQVTGGITLVVTA